MLQIPKNVMQIGEVNPHTKIYMEDYVHTFLERRKKTEEYLAFGQKEERGGVLYYLIYGVERRKDWERGSYPYFKKYERIGTIEGTADRRIFKPVRGSGIALDGYFIFYEQNEDMQSYMIVVRETEKISGSEEKEEVMEAVRTHREQRRKELAAAEEHKTETRRGWKQKSPIRETETEEAAQNGTRKTENASASRWGTKTERSAQVPQDGVLREKGTSASGAVQSSESFADKSERAKKSIFQNRRILTEQPAERAKRREKLSRSMQRESKKKAVFIKRKEEKGAALQRGRQVRPHTWTIPDLCRAGSMLLLLLLVVMGLTSINQYPDMKAVTDLFSNAAKAVAEKNGTVTVDAEPQEGGLIVEEATAGQEESAAVAEAVMDEAETGEDLMLAENGIGTIQWMIGQKETSNDSAEAGQEADDENQGNDAQQENSALQIESEAKGTDTGLTDTAQQGDETAEQAKASENSGADESEAENATQAIARPVSYVVKKGDSLAGIVRKFYGNTSMLKEICNVNNIEDPDQIHPGQNILLP